ncbi:hypothetical protein [Limnofasciculus baicalensis]|nr:hypothetical protein [Limnofasciculus baicalensis]
MAGLIGSKTILNASTSSALSLSRLPFSTSLNRGGLNQALA